MIEHGDEVRSFESGDDDVRIGVAQCHDVYSPVRVFRRELSDTTTETTSMFFKNVGELRDLQIALNEFLADIDQPG